MSVAGVSPAVARQLLAFELNRVVAASAVSHGDVARRLGLHRVTVSQFLAGKNLPTRLSLEVMLAYLNAAERFPDLAELLAIARTDASKSQWRQDRPLPYEVGSSGWLSGDGGLALGLEATASTVEVFDTTMICPLLQTAAYARQVAEPVAVADKDWERRQALIIDDESTTRLCWVVEERALRRPVCGPSVMAEQWAHVLRMSRRPNVTVRVIPDAIGVHAGLTGPFRIYRSKHWAVVCEQTRSQTLYSAEPDAVTDFSRVMADLMLAALDPDQSREFLAVLGRQARPAS